MGEHPNESSRICDGAGGITIPISAFLELLLDLRGDNPANVGDITNAMKYVTWNNAKSFRLMNENINRLESNERSRVHEIAHRQGRLEDLVIGMQTNQDM